MISKLSYVSKGRKVRVRLLFMFLHTFSSLVYFAKSTLRLKMESSRQRDPDKILLLHLTSPVPKDFSGPLSS